MVLREICDDYENIDQIIFPNVAKKCAKLGLRIDRAEIVTALGELIEVSTLLTIRGGHLTTKAIPASSLEWGSCALVCFVRARP